MKTIKNILICFFVLMSCNQKTEKDLWIEEAVEIKYSKEREKEIWGKQLRGHSSELFYGTSLYSLAVAIEKNKKKDISELIKEIPDKDINFQELKFNTTIGHFAITHNNIDVLIPLINKGLKCNTQDVEGNSLITNINTVSNSRHDNSLKALKLMINKGGDVNLLNEKSITSRTPLITASGSNLENVKVLINAGADPNFTYKDNPEDQFPESPLISALKTKRIDIVEYLIYDVKVDFKSLKYSPKSKYNPGGYKILGYLRLMTFKFQSEKYKQKMRLVSFLKEHGLDYWSTPIPNRILKNKNFDESYLKNY